MSNVSLKTSCHIISAANFLTDIIRACWLSRSLELFLGCKVGSVCRGRMQSAMKYRYHLDTEFKEALEHASDRGTNSKVLLCMADGREFESVN